MGNVMKRTPAPVKLTSETIMQSLGLIKAACNGRQRYAPPLGSESLAKTAIRGILKAAEARYVPGDPSVLAGETLNKPLNTGAVTQSAGAPDMRFVSEILTNTRHKIAAAQQRFWGFVLPNGISIEPQLCSDLVKQAMAPFLPPQGVPQAAAPGIPQHPAVPTAPPASTLPQGTGPAMPGHQTMTGVAQRPIGLDRPQDTRAAALPGTPGHAATNVIDQRGALDPRGLTIDGNNSASVQKFASFSVAGWFREKASMSLSPFAGPQDPEDEKRRPRRTPWQGIGLGTGLGLMGGAALGGAYGLASDQEVGRVRKSVADYKPEAFTQGQIPPNHTGLTYYERLLSPAAQLKPFGQPVGTAMVALRSSPALMKALGTDAYTLKTPSEQFGVSGAAHYNMFGNGPVPAYAHQVKARLATQPVDPSLGAPAGSMYSDWMGRKFEDFVAQHTGQRINPFEFTTKFMPHEDQLGLMEKFHQSLSPAEQAYRIKMEDPGAGYASQVNNYLPKAEGFVNFRDKLKNFGIASLGAGAGAVGGNMLYDALNDDDPTNDSALMRAASTLGGAGLGGAAAYYGGTQAGRQSIQNLLGRITKSAEAAEQKAGPGRFITFDELKAYGDDQTLEMIKKGHGRKKCRACGAESQCRCPTSVHGPLPGRMIGPEDCWECRGAAEKQAADETWIGVDLDGTLAKYTTWKGEDHIGEPIPLMVNRVKEWLDAGKDVRIMTARVADDPDGKIAKVIQDWAEEHLGKRLPVTNVKDHQMEALWDDKAHRVEKNTGVKLAARKPLDPQFLALPGIQNILRSLAVKPTAEGRFVPV
jgi:hypothetical protein